VEVAEEMPEQGRPKEDGEGIEDAEVDAEGTDEVLPPTGSTLGNEPPERKEGHSERSSGSEAGCLPMKDRMAAAYKEKKEGWVDGSVTWGKKKKKI